MAYYISQAVVVLAALITAWTYFMKKQAWICAFCSLASVLFAVQYGLLGAWSGCASNVVAAIGYVVFYLYARKGKETPSLIFMSLLVVLICTGCVGFDGYLSVMGLCSGSLFLYSVWQKNNLIYKILGIITCAIFAVYNGLYRSWFGMAVEVALIVVDFVAVIKFAIEAKKKRKAEKADVLVETK